MYDSEYFRKVIGSNYNPNELYNTTYSKDESVNIRSTDTLLAQDVNVVNNTPIQPVVSNISEPTYNVNNIKTDSALEYLHNMNNSNTEETSTHLYDNINKQVSVNLYNNVDQEVSTEPYKNVNTEPVLQETYNVSSNNTKLSYPDIYNVINPMVDTILKNRQNMEYNEATINAMSTEIYNALEVDVNPQKTTETNTFNNTIQVSTKPKNYLLHDLIKIMLIGKIEKGQ